MVMQAVGAGLSLASSAAGTGLAIKNLLNSKKTSSAQQAAKQQYEYNLALQKEAQNYNTYAFQHRYQWEAADKEAAGLSQLYGLSSPSSPTSTSASVGMPEYVNEQSIKQEMALKGIQLGQSGAAVLADVNLKNQETQNKKLEANFTAMETVNSYLRALYTKKEVNAYDKKLIAELGKIKSEITSNISTAIKNNAEAGSAIALKNKINAETTGLNSTNEKLKVLAKIYKENPGLAATFIGSQEAGGGDISAILGALGGLGGEKLGGKKEYRPKFYTGDRRFSDYVKENLRKHRVR